MKTMLRILSVMKRDYLARNPENWKFRVQWSGYEPQEDSWFNWRAVKDLTNGSPET